MKIHNSNKTFRPIVFELEEQWQAERLKEVLAYAVKAIEKAQYCYDEEDLKKFINEIMEAL